MLDMFKLKSSHQRMKRQLLIVMLVIFAWSVAIGFILGLATTSVHTTNPTPSVGTLEVVPAQYQLGQELYIENCSTCHIALPPAVFPTQTWKNLVEDSQHYGAQIQPLVHPQRILVWKYISTFSRVQLQDEEIPYRLNRSLDPFISKPYILVSNYQYL
jgi:hypothetical protein